MEASSLRLRPDFNVDHSVRLYFESISLRFGLLDGNDSNACEKSVGLHPPQAPWPTWCEIHIDATWERCRLAHGRMLLVVHDLNLSTLSIQESNVSLLTRPTSIRRSLSSAYAAICQTIRTAYIPFN